MISVRVSAFGFVDKHKVNLQGDADLFLSSVVLPVFLLSVQLESYEKVKPCFAWRHIREKPLLFALRRRADYLHMIFPYATILHVFAGRGRIPGHLVYLTLFSVFLQSEANCGLYDLSVPHVSCFYMRVTLSIVCRAREMSVAFCASPSPSMLHLTYSLQCLRGIFIRGGRQALLIEW